jgi:choline-sulfatase
VRTAIAGALFTLLLPLVAQGAGAPDSPPAKAIPPRSLLLISLDTTRADHLHCYGYPLPTSPALDRLASEGLLFENVFTQAVNTGPSHVTIFTGLLPMGHQVRFNGVPLSPEFETLTSLLAKSGYRTGAFVSGYTLLASQCGLNRGFEVYDDAFTTQDRRGAETVDRALAWLKGLPADKPYFLFVHLFDPHGKYEPPPGFADKFRTTIKYEPIASVDLIPDYQRFELPGGGVSLDPGDYIARYDGEIAYADSQIRRLLEEVGEKPVVIFTSDHGETLVERSPYFSHGARLNEEAIRVPLIIRAPGQAPKGKRISGIARLVDLLPTALALLGQPPPPKLVGRSLLPFARLGAIPPGATVVTEGRAAPMTVGDQRLIFPPRGLIFSARDNRYKLIDYPTSAGSVYELFDLEKDKGEKQGTFGLQTARVSTVYQALDLYLVSGHLPDPPDLDEEAKKKLRSLGYVN